MHEGDIQNSADQGGKCIDALLQNDRNAVDHHVTENAAADTGDHADKDRQKRNELARFLGLKKLKPAFSYHGNVIGVTGVNPQGVKVGVCSGGAGDFAETAKNIGCGLFITGEASWGDVIAAENCGMEMICAGHYATETFGVKALARAVREKLNVETQFLPRAASADPLALNCVRGGRKCGRIRTNQGVMK